ncbi:MAG: hypothetical protein WA001_05660 [Patescibacteria group bacterium]
MNKFLLVVFALPFIAGCEIQTGPRAPFSRTVRTPDIDITPGEVNSDGKYEACMRREYAMLPPSPPPGPDAVRYAELVEQKEQKCHDRAVNAVPGVGRYGARGGYAGGFVGRQGGYGPYPGEFAGVQTVQVTGAGQVGLEHLGMTAVPVVVTSANVQSPSGQPTSDFNKKTARELARDHERLCALEAAQGKPCDDANAKK